MGLRLRTLPLIAALICALCVPVFPAKTAKTVDDWAKQLKSSNIKQRDEALYNLLGSRDPKATDALLSEFRNPSAPEDVLIGILDDDSRRAIRPDMLDPAVVLRLMRSKNEKLRREATSALDTVEMPRDMAVAHMQDADPLVRVVAARRLVDFMDERGIAIALGCLRSENQEIKFHALDALRSVMGPSSIETAKKLIKDENPYLRAWAVEHLGQLRDRALLEAFTSILSDDASREVRSAAAKAIGHIGDPSSVPVLIKAIKGDDIEEAASQALFEITAPAALPQFVAALKDKNAWVRATAVQCIFNFDDEAADDAVLALVKSKKGLESLDEHAIGLPQWIYGDGIQEQINRRKWARAAPKMEFFDPPSFGSTKISDLVAGIGSNEAKKVRRCIDSLKARKDKDSVAPLIALLKHKKADVRNNAAYLLGFMGDERACRPLVECLAGGDRTATNAARALQRLRRYDLARAGVVKMLNAKDANTRITAAVIIGDARDKSALGALAAKLQDPDVEVRKSLVYAISRIDGADAAKALLPILAGGKGSGGLLAEIDLHQYPGFVFEAAAHMKDASAIVPDVIGLLQSKDKDLAQDAAWLLGQWKEKRALDPLLNLLGTIRPDRYTNGGLRMALVKALGEIGDAKAVPALIAQTEQDRFMAGVVCEALGKIKSEQSYNYLLEMVNSPFTDGWMWASRGLADMRDPRAADALAARAEMCVDAAIALGRLGDKRAYSPLLRFSKNYGGGPNLHLALLDTKDPRVLEPYLRRDPEEEGRYFSADGLSGIARFKSDAAVQILMKELLMSCQFFSPVILTSIVTYEDEKHVTVGYFRPDNIDKVQTAIFPALEEATGQKFGTDVAKWIAWHKQAAKKGAK